MNKKSLFLSASLSAFILVVIAGVIRAGASGFWFGGSNSPSGSVALVPVNSPTQPPTALPSATLTSSPFISPEQASTIASGYINRSDVYSIDSTKVDGQDAYKVTFSSGDQVYVNAQGLVIWHTLLSVTVVQSAPHGQASSGGGRPSSGTQSGGSPTATRSPGGGGGGDDSGGDE